MEYNFREIEKKWQKRWVEMQTYRVSEDEGKKKFYVLNMFPYPSGAGLHVGHPLGYIASDIYARYKRLQGYNVLNPMGYDAYGLPAEQYAIQTGQHPAITTVNNINRYREQLDKIGFSFDWNREVRTCDPKYYKWTQWAFQKMFNSYYRNQAPSGSPKGEAPSNSPKGESPNGMNEEIKNATANNTVDAASPLGGNEGGFGFKPGARPISELIAWFEKHGTKGLDVAQGEELTFTAEEWNSWDEKRQQEVLMNYRIAYLGETMVNWCPQLGTVLANDEVVDGVSERGGYPVVQKKMRQWCLRVSAYAQRLLDGLETIDWTDSLKETQRNWIGRSEGTEMRFKVAPSSSPKGEGPNGMNEEIKNATANNTADAASPLGGNEGGFTIFTTRADTIFGVTFMVLAPESELVDQLTTAEQRAAVDEYIAYVKKRTERERISDHKVTGVFSGSYAINPFTGEEIPIWISEYVLAGYGTGAIMAVPAHDSRDYAFAKHFNLPIIPLIEGADVSEQSFDAKEGIVMNSPAAPSSSPKGESPNGMEQAPSNSPKGESLNGMEQAPSNSPKGESLNGMEHNINNESAKSMADAASPLGGNEGGFSLNGLTVKEAIAKTKEYVKSHNLGRVKVNYRLRDAIFSRQRYWGEPFPVYYKDGMPYMIPESCLPLELPEVAKFLPTETGEPPLGHATKWAWDTEKNCVVENALIDNVKVFPLELNTMPGFAGSSAYYLRYMDPHDDDALVAKDVDDYWQNVDLYVGGTEHATGHLIYSRFWNKFLYDYGVSCKEEPFQKLVNQGMIQGRSNFVYRVIEAPSGSPKGESPNGMEHNINNETAKNMADASSPLGGNEGGLFVSAGLKDKYNVTPLHVDVNIVSNDVLDIEAFRAWRPEYKNAEFILEDGKYVCGWAVEKMSKSMFNVVNPDMIVEKYGADTLRLYEMFLGPVEQSKPWDTNGIDGCHRFLKKFWGLYYDNRSDAFIVDDESPKPESLKSVHKLIKKVTQDIEHFSYNTSISAFMICVNELMQQKCHSRSLLKTLVVLIAPFAPHIAEELWEALGGQGSVCYAEWPRWDEKYLVESEMQLTVSFNGKARYQKVFPAGAGSDEVQKAVLEDERSAKYMEGKQVVKVIVVPKKIVNIVMK